MNALTSAIGNVTSKVTSAVSNLVPGNGKNKNLTVVAEGTPNGNVAVMANVGVPAVGGRRHRNRRNTARKNNTRRRRNNTRRNNMRRRRNTRRH